MYKKKNFHRSLWLFTAMAVYMKRLTKYVQKEKLSSFVVAVYGHGGSCTQ